MNNVFGNAGATIATSVQTNKVFSFKTAIDNLEEEIQQLQQEVSYCRKEVRNLKSEQDTVKDVSETKCGDIERHLKNEINKLETAINKSNLK